MAIVLTILLMIAGVVAPDEASPTTRAAPVEATATTQPSDVDRSLDELTARDPRVRAGAREQLMLLTRADLPMLESAVAARVPLRPALRGALHEIVTHVYLVGRHDFAGERPGYLGVTPSNDGQPPDVQTRLRGHDAFRMLQDGDVIVGLSTAASGAPMAQVASFIQLRALLVDTTPGDWVTVRVMRNGVPLEVRLRVGPASTLPMRGEPDPAYEIAERYWKTSFDRPLRRATTRKVDGRVMNDE